MKDANIAPFFGCLYPGLCDIARKNGYALTIHGSVVTDLDLVAIPWTPEAVSAQELRDALAKHISGLDYRGLLERDCPWFTPAQIDQLLMQGQHDPETKPHGRLAWNLYLHAGIKIDLSVMPRVPVPAPLPGIRERSRQLAVFLSDSAKRATASE